MYLLYLLYEFEIIYYIYVINFISFTYCFNGESYRQHFLEALVHLLMLRCGRLNMAWIWQNYGTTRNQPVECTNQGREPDVTLQTARLESTGACVWHTKELIQIKVNFASKQRQLSC